MSGDGSSGEVLGALVAVQLSAIEPQREAAIANLERRRADEHADLEDALGHGGEDLLRALVVDVTLRAGHRLTPIASAPA